MRKIQEDRLVTAGRVVDYLAENQPDLADNEAVSDQVAAVTAAYAKMSGAHGQAIKTTKPLTKEGRAAKAQVIDLLPALLGPMGRVAETLNDNDLLASVTLSGKQLRKLRPLAFLAVTNAMLGLATRPDVATGIARYGLKATTLQPLHAAVAALQQAMPAPRKAIDTRVLAVGNLENLMADLMDALRDLDQDMKVFKLLDRALYDGYLQMRKIINSGGGSGKADEAPAGAQM